ncbi:DUF397 domain-containing protein [Actinocorallia sp. API 0066]|nr:DUF397 domain-containing protein [Actinocorallia sp. API 0066]MCD0448163.1 DUF397 domain-containing protein [Actinocorallia sp. API 0066]
MSTITAVGLRDSKHVDLGHLAVTTPRFRSFIRSIKANDQ